jgi:Crp-like helix-turn-helix protein
MQSARVPLNQIDLAHAAGLTVVHVNHTIHELRELGVLSKDRRIIEVIDSDRLFSIENFDGNYLSRNGGFLGGSVRTVARTHRQRQMRGVGTARKTAWQTIAR